MGGRARLCQAQKHDIIGDPTTVGYEAKLVPGTQGGSR